jgi:RNAse (barnase) inhibitor barstar
MLDSSMLSKVSWQCVHFAHVGELANFDAALLEQGVVSLEMDGRGAGSNEELLARLAEALRFPDYFGQNWDAVDDCLCDMEWLPATGYVLIVRNARELWAGNVPGAGKLIEVWLFAAEYWATQTVPLHLVFAW